MSIMSAARLPEAESVLAETRASSSSSSSTVARKFVSPFLAVEDDTLQSCIAHLGEMIEEEHPMNASGALFIAGTEVQEGGDRSGDGRVASVARIIPPFLDLGSGDGRVCIHVAKTLRIRAVGIELDEDLVFAARNAAEKAGVAALCEFRTADIMDFRGWAAAPNGDGHDLQVEGSRDDHCAKFIAPPPHTEVPDQHDDASSAAATAGAGEEVSLSKTKRWSAVFVHLLPEVLRVLAEPVFALGCPVVAVKFFFSDEGAVVSSARMGAGSPPRDGRSAGRAADIVRSFRGGSRALRRPRRRGRGWEIYWGTDDVVSEGGGGASATITGGGASPSEDADHIVGRGDRAEDLFADRAQDLFADRAQDLFAGRREELFADQQHVGTATEDGVVE